MQVLFLIAVSAITQQAGDWTRLEGELAPRSHGTRIHATDAYAVESSGRECIELVGNGSWIEFDIEQPAEGVVLRYSVPDTADGVGLDLPLDVVVNDSRAAALTLTSRLSHLYGSEFEESGDPGDGDHRRFFDEVRFRTDLTQGDQVSLVRPGEPHADDLPVLVDFLELERVPDAIAKPEGALDLVEDFGAAANDEIDDLGALVDALDACSRLRKTLYLPPGRFHFSNHIVPPPHITIQGAGMWWTEIEWDSRSKGKSGGFYPREDATEIVLKDFYMRGQASVRGEGGQPFNGPWGENSRLENIWWEHLNNARFTDSHGLRIVGCRARNITAGGIILFGGTVDAVVEHCHVRYAGDDGIGTFASGVKGRRSEVNRNNVIRHNLVELTTRAGGIGIFGGIATKVHDNTIIDTLHSAQADIRFTTSFDQYPFGQEEPTMVHDNVMRGFRGQMGSILFATRHSATSNIFLRNNQITGLDGPAIYFRCQTPQPSERITIEDLQIEFREDTASPTIVSERRFDGRVELRNVDVSGGPGRIENGSHELTLDLDPRCEGWEEIPIRSNR